MIKLMFRAAVVILLSNASIYSQTPEIEWVRPIYGTTATAPLSATVTDMCTDADGNTYLTGEFRNEIKFGPITLPGTSEAALFLAKYNAEGTPLWAVKITANAPTAFSAFGNSAKVDADGLGNVYLCANFEAASIDFNNGVVLNQHCTNNCREGFLVKLNGQGVFQFIKSLHAASGEPFNVAGVVAAADGKHYLTGSFTGTELWLQGGANIGGITEDAFFVVQYNAAGGAEWVAFLPPNTGVPDATAIAISPDGERIAITGRYTDAQINFGNGAVTSSTSNSKQFVVWFNTSGQPMGAGTLGAASIEVFDISVNADYKVWAACDFSGSLTWNDANITNINGTNAAAALVAVGAAQTGQLVAYVGFNGNSYPLNTFTIGPDDKFYTGGTTREMLSPGGINLGFQGCADIVLSGGVGTTANWVKSIGGTGCEIIQNDYYGTLMDTDENGNLYICGHFQNGASAGGSAIPGNGLWVGKFSTGPVGVDDNVMADKQLLLSPNPASGIIQISAPGFSDSGLIKIYDCYGKQIVEKQLEGDNISFNVSDWQSGIYFVTLINEKGTVMQSAKLVVE